MNVDALVAYGNKRAKLLSRPRNDQIIDLLIEQYRDVLKQQERLIELLCHALDRIDELEEKEKKTP